LRTDSDGDSLPADLSGPAEVGPGATTRAFAVAEGERYATVATLAEGGMGRVALVLDRRLNRQVALKRPRASSPGSRARLEQEAAITAQLEHPNVVAVHDAGEDGDGAFYTMRLVRGRSLEEVLAGAPLAARLNTLRHFLATCDGVAFAHSVGILHRDLKPHNVMIGEFGETQVVDWGVARPIGAADTSSWRAVLPDGPAETVAGEVVGTPAYMSPEQARGGAPLDRRSDVWSLGGILYRVVCGRAPFSGDAATVLRARRDGLTPERAATLAPDAPAELVAILERAMAPSPEARYPDAKALGADVAAYLDGRRVHAHDYTALELLRRLVRAWRVPLGVAAVALLVLAVGAVVATQNVVAERNRAVDAERRTAEALVTALLTESRREADDGARPEAELAAARALVLGGGPEARGALMLGSPAARPTPEDEAVVPAGRVVFDGRGARWVQLGDDVALYAWGDPPGAPRWRAPVAGRAAAFDEAGHVVVTDAEDRAWVLSTRDGAVVGEPRHAPSADRVVAGGGRVVTTRGWSFTPVLPRPSPEDRACPPRRVLVGLALGGVRDVALCDDGLRLRERGADWRELTPRGEDGAVLSLTPTALALSPDEGRVALADERGGLAVVALEDGRVVATATPEHRGLRGLSWSPSGSRLALVGVQDGVRVLDARGVEQLRLPRRLGRAARWRDDDTLVTFGEGRGVVWRLPAPVVEVVDGAPGGVASVAVARSGAVAVARGTGVVEVAVAGTRRALRFGDQVVKRVAFSGDGRWLGVAAMSAPGLSWVDTARWEVARYDPGSALRRVARLGPDGVVTASWEAPIALVGPEGPRRAGQPGEPEALDLDDAPDGSWVAVLEDGTGAVFGTDGGVPWPIGRWPEAVAVGAGDDHVIVATPGALHRVPRRGGAAEVWPFDREVAPPQDVEVAGDGTVALAGLDGVVRVHGRDGALLAVLRGHDERVVALAFGPDDALWTGSWDGVARRWDLTALRASPEALAAAVGRAWAAPLPR